MLREKSAAAVCSEWEVPLQGAPRGLPGFFNLGKNYNCLSVNEPCIRSNK